MSLLLDDDEVFQPPMKAVKVDVQVLDCDEETPCVNVDQPTHTPPSRSESHTTRAATSPIAAAGTESTPSKSVAQEGAAVTLARQGGNGMLKMEALLFGMPKVSVVSGGPPKHTRRSTVTTDDALAAADRTPLAQKSQPPASQMSSEVRSLVSNTTQPKVVSGARSPSSTSLSPSTTQRHTSVVSFDEPLLASQDSLADTRSAQTSPAKPVDSVSASPPARPPAAQPLANSADVVSPQPAKTQMKLSDFFSKMACKR